MKIITKKIEIMFDDRPTGFLKSPTKAIWTRGAICRHFFDNVINLSVSERASQVIKVGVMLDYFLEIEFHLSGVGSTQAIFISLGHLGCCARMILKNRAIIGSEVGNIIFPIAFSCHRLKKFGILITKTDPSNCASLPPIFALVRK